MLIFTDGSAINNSENISDCTENIHIFVDCQSAIHAITQQNENYHNSTISSIRENFDISKKVKSIKIIYCPAHKGIKDNKTADELTKIATEKAKTLEPTYNIASDIKTENPKLTHEKWQRIWNSSPNNII